VERLLRVLHLEDNAADGELMERALLQAGFEAGITRVETRTEFIAALEQTHFDLIVSDFSLPSFDGLAALDIVRERDSETPFIFVSGTIGEDRAAESLRRGATDYVLKDRLSRLPSAIRRSFEEQNERQARRRAEEQTRQMEKQLLRAQRLETVGLIAGGIAHDLNNVLAPILIGISSLKRRMTDESGQRLLGVMETSVERGADIVRQVLTFARGAPSGGTFETRDMIRGIEKLLGASLPRTVALEITLADDLWPLAGDATQLQQVLLNLAINARDAMSNGGRLVIQADNVTDPTGSYVRIRVADTGHGMPADVREKIFEAFYTTKAEGTGIGLSMVASIVERHGGRIEVDSEPGRGTEFRVFLPRVPASALREARGKGELLLVVDQGALREILKGTLEAYGYRVLCADDATQALTLYETHGRNVAAVLANLALPDLSAADLLRSLAEQDPRVKVIDTGGSALPDGTTTDVLRAALPKPYSPDKLLDTVAKVLATA
jgi:signal transduction histidine kinase